MSSEQVDGDRRAPRGRASPSPRPAAGRCATSVSSSWPSSSLDILAFLFVPPFPKGGQPGDACAFPVCFINGTLEFPPPHVVLDLDPGNPMPTGSAVVTFHPSITSTIADDVDHHGHPASSWPSWRRAACGMVPGRSRTCASSPTRSLENFGVGSAASRPGRTSRCSPSFFVLILFCNWSGLIPPVGKIEELRAPDVAT